MTGPLPGFLAPLTVPASWLYRAAVNRRNARFESGRAVESIGVPVISVGNITAGGTGKTPHVALIADMLLATGHRPAIAMRGYLARPKERSDEEAEYADRCPEVPVVADPDRVAALRRFLPEHSEIDCVILDDGFQHRRLARDLDLVLIDATQHTFDDKLLPAGHLREPAASLRRADGVILTRCRGEEERELGFIERHHGRPPLAATRHAWAGLHLHHRDESERPVTWLDGRRVLTVLGVGNPRSITTQLAAVGAEIAADVRVRDHERYDRPKTVLIRTLCEGVDAVVTTAKDWVKLRRLIDCTSWPVPIVVPKLTIEILGGERELQEMIARVFDSDS